MNAILFGMPGGTELLVMLFVVMLLFGGSRLPQLAKGIGQSIKEFKKGVAEIDDGLDTEEQPRAQTRLPAAASMAVGAEEIARDRSVTTERA